MNVLGINSFFHDSAAALVIDGKVVAAADEERFNREKHSTEFPTRAIQYCLRQAGVQASDLDVVAYSRDPRARFLKKAKFFLARFPRSIPMLRGRFTKWKRILSLEEELAEALGADFLGPTKLVHHHLAHAASAYYCSPFDSSAVLSIDGGGDFASTLLAYGQGTGLSSLGEVSYPDSLGMIYTLVTLHLGFGAGDEGKTMGLAPYGRPAFLPHFREMIRVTEDGLFSIDPAFFCYQLRGADYFVPENIDVRRLVTQKFIDALGPPRGVHEPITSHHEDIARSLQDRLEEVVFELLGTLYQRTGSRRLCLAGGVALNSVLNGKIREKTPFEELYVQPAAGDGGTAIGAALVAAAEDPSFARAPMHHAYLGPGFGDPEISSFLESEDVPESVDVSHCDDLVEETAEMIAGGAIIGWFQGRMEIGPRALGNRSILANPLQPDMKDVLNSRVKFREGFRPFAPSVPWECAREFFEVDHETPFMLEVCRVRERFRPMLPAITHVDGSARLQTVRKEHNPLYYALLHAVGRRTGIPVLLNTSFNVKGEPIVCSPEDALRCFLGTNLDALVLGSHLLVKKKKSVVCRSGEASLDRDGVGITGGASS